MRQAMDVLLVVDMQEGLLSGAPKHDLTGVVRRINELAERVRQRGGLVMYVQHEGPPGDEFEPHKNGWQLLSTLVRDERDRVVKKTFNDAFFETSLAEELARVGASRLLVTGWATDFCVDATVRSAAARGFRVVVVADAHTVSNRPHLEARRVITHHQFIWQNLIARHPVEIRAASEL